MKGKNGVGTTRFFGLVRYFTNPVVSHCSVSLVTAKDSQ